MKASPRRSVIWMTALAISASHGCKPVVDVCSPNDSCGETSVCVAGRCQNTGGATPKITSTVRELSAPDQVGGDSTSSPVADLSAGPMRFSVTARCQRAVEAFLLVEPRWSMEGEDLPVELRLSRDGGRTATRIVVQGRARERLRVPIPELARGGIYRLEARSGRGLSLVRRPYVEDGMSYIGPQIECYLNSAEAQPGNFVNTSTARSSI